jgi:hypothetical protein
VRITEMREERNMREERHKCANVTSPSFGKETFRAFFLVFCFEVQS